MTRSGDTRTVRAARLANNAPARQLSATLVAVPVGYLSVEVSFLGEVVQGLDVRLQGHGIDHATTTDAQGRCQFGLPVPIGNYTCSIPHQEEATVTTVEKLDRPFLLTLPVGRASFDLQPGGSK